MLPLEEMYRVVENLKAQDKSVVFTNGCFDLLHPGHTRYLSDARKLGDLLVVAINSDQGVRALKGAGRPIFPQGERAELLAALEDVDYVTIFDEPTPRSIIARMRPDVLVKGAGWRPDEIVGRAEVEAAGGRVVSMPAVFAFSTTAIVDAIQKIRG